MPRHQRRRQGNRPLRSAAGDGGDDADRLAVGDLGVEAVEVAHVVVVDEHVDELAQVAVLVEQTVLEAGWAASSALMTSTSVPAATSTVDAPPDSGRRVVGMRTVTAMARNPTARSAYPRMDGHGALRERSCAPCT